MQNQLWCKVCNQAVSVGVGRGVAAAVVPLAGMLAAGLPKLFRRKRFSFVQTAAQAAAGAGAAYLASRYLVPKLQGAVCGQCGGEAVARPSAA